MIKRFALLVAIAITLMVITSLGQYSRISEPKTIPNSPISYGTLYDLWNGNAYFDRQTYTVLQTDGSGHNPVHEVAPLQVNSSTIFLYYRSYLDSQGNRLGGGGIGLAISKDGGATFSLYNGGKSVVSPGPNSCDPDSYYAVAPSVVIVAGIYYMVYEGANWIYAAGCNDIYTGAIDLATSSDGITWYKQGVILKPYPLSFECGNIGTPSIGYFSPNGNPQFYIFYHGSCWDSNLSRRLNRIGMAYGTQLNILTLTKSGQVMQLGGWNNWDSEVNSRASVVQEIGGDGKTYYYMTFEGAQYAYCDQGNWGWGIARSVDLVNWVKYQYNPIRQAYQGKDCGSDLPYIIENYGTGVVTVYQAWDTTNCCIAGPGLRNVLLLGTDPYLTIFSATNQCLNFHDVGRAEADGWSANTAQDSAGYLCKGPKAPLGQHYYAAIFMEQIDACCTLFNSGDTTITVSGTDSGGSPFPSVDVQRKDFQHNYQYQGFEYQFASTAGHTYNFTTYWYNKAYIKQEMVFLRQLDDFAIQSIPSSVTVVAGAPTSFTINVTGWQGFYQTVQPSASVDPPSGLNVDCSAPLLPCWAEACDVNALAAGSYLVTIAATSGPMTHYAFVRYTVTYFSISASPTSLNVNIGTPGTSTITIGAVMGFNGVVSLSTNSTSCAVNPPSVTGYGSASLSCTFSSVSAVHVTVTALSGTRSKTATVTYVVGPPLVPSFTFTPTNPQPGGTITFTGQASGGLAPYSFSWNFGDGGTATGASAIHSYYQHGTYTVTFRVADSSGQTATTSRSVVVQTPPVSPSFTFSPIYPTTGQTVSFSGGATGGTPPYQYSWTFGDGASVSGTATPTHVYGTAGCYTVTLIATDTSANTGSTSQQVPVATTCVSGGGGGGGGPKPQSPIQSSAPSIALSPPQTNTLPSLSVQEKSRPVWPNAKILMTRESRNEA